MANWGKTAGVVSGLAVGLTSGVFLAALNPILPKTDRTTVSSAPEQSTGSPASLSEQSDGTVASTEISQSSSGGVNQSPTLDLGKTAARTPTPAPDQSPGGVVVTESQDSAPSSVENARQRPVNAEVAVLTTETQVPAETELSISMPVVADTPETSRLALINPEDGAENQPTVSSDPAAPVEMRRPLAETVGPDALIGETNENGNDLPRLNPDGTVERQDIRDSRRIDVLEDTAIVLPQLDREPGKAPASKPATVGTQAPLRILPIVPVPEKDAETAGSQPRSDTLRSAAFSPDSQPNTSGTFATLGSRLPTIGDTGADGISTLGKSAISKRIPTIGEDEPVLSGQIATPAVGALRANANEFTPTGKPLVSVVLLDNGQIEGQLSKFARLGLPLAIAIPVDQPDVPAKSRAYRNAGFEVLALSPRDVKLSLPGGQTDEQVAELLQRFFTLMPDAMGLIDRPAALLQRDQRLVRSVVGYFAQTGHGIITYAGGLNAAPRLADQQDVAFGVVSHILDGSQDTEAVLSGYLNRAARTARSKGSAIVLAMPNDQTLSTLLNWSLGINARTVSFAPVSAALMAGNP